MMARALALSALDRAPRRRQARAREHAGRVSRRRRARLPRLRMRRQAQSADGVPFLLHDATLERTTSGHGPAAALHLERAVAPRRRRLAQPRLRRRAAAEPRRHRALLPAQRLCAQHRDQADAGPRSRNRPGRRAGGRAALGRSRREAAAQLVPAGRARRRARRRAAAAARPAARHAARRLARRSAGARLRRRRHELPADGCGGARPHPRGRPARAGLHRERPGRSAAARRARHRRPHHRRRRPLLARPGRRRRRRARLRRLRRAAPSAPRRRARAHRRACCAAGRAAWSRRSAAAPRA